MNRIGGKYGASHLGTAAITGSGVVTDYMQGKSAEEIVLNSIFSAGVGKFGQYNSERTKTNPDIMSALFAAGADTMIDKNDAEEEKKRVDFNK